MHACPPAPWTCRGSLLLRLHLGNLFYFRVTLLSISPT